MNRAKTNRGVNFGIAISSIVDLLPLFVMNPKLAILYEFLQSLSPSSARRRGKPVHYSWPSLVLFFMVMFLKGIHSFQAMARYAQQHYGWFGWQSAPCRHTLARRFEALPGVVYRLM